MGLAIGIDLGTGFSSVGVFRNDRFEGIENEDGSLITPSIVAFTDTERLIGNAAKNQLAMNPNNTVFDAHRLIGRKFSDSEVQSDMKHFGFKVIDRLGRPAIEVEFKGEDKVFVPEEIIAMILERMKQLAERHLGVDVSIRDAAFIAGLNPIRIIDGPTCAAVSYGFSKPNEDIMKELNVLIYDFGAGTFGATLMTILTEGSLHIFEVKSVAGDIHLGGEDFNNRLVNHFVNEFKRKNKKDITSNVRALRRLRTSCERAKCSLSSSTIAAVEIDSLFEGHDFYTSITRSRFEELVQDLVRSSTFPLDRVLADAKINKSEVHEVVLVGGSTRIPRVQKLVADYFGKTPLKSINPDLAACHGAAILASILSGDTSSKSHQDSMLMDVQPISLGIETIGGQMTKVVTRNTTIPTKKTEFFSTEYSIENSRESHYPVCPLPISIYEGERRRVKDNNLLGKIHIPARSSGYEYAQYPAQVEVIFDIYYDKPSVSVFDPATKKNLGTLLYYADSNVSKDEIERMMADAERYRADDVVEATRVAAKNALESQIYSLNNFINDFENSRWLEASEKERVETENSEALNWLEENQWGDTEEFETQQKNLKATANLLVKKLEEAKSKKTNLSSSEPSEPEVPSFAPKFPSHTRADTPVNHLRTAEQRLGKYFRSPSANVRTRFTEFELQDISNLLRELGYVSWSREPRLYIVLRVIEQLQLLDSFIDRGITDLWFPFTRTSLPEILTASMRADFEKAQALVLKEVHSDRNSPDVSDEHKFSLFDEQSPTLGADRLSDHWFRRLRDLVFPTILTSTRTGDCVKIAILDSGIDLDEDFIFMNRGRITCQSFLSEDQGIEDRIGHGTHAAALLLRVAPTAHIYAARITRLGSLEDTSCIERAIRHAINEWKVDIITMSFGFPLLEEKLHGIHTAINEAFVSNVLMFAAARNDGGNDGIAYPANQDQVICVNSTDGRGNPSKYNPTPVIGKNLSVLGEDVLSSWPTHLENGRQRKSGTSYATPIAAAIAAIILDYSQQKMQSSDKYAISKLRTPRGMKAALDLMSEERGGYRYIVPWDLFNEGRSNIYGTILDTLRHV